MLRSCLQIEDKVI